MHKKNFLILLIFTLEYSTAGSQDPFSGKRAFANIDTLCMPVFEGRKTGLEGARKAALWIASSFKKWGLEPGGDGGSFLQEYPLIVTDQKKRSRIELENGFFGPVRYQQGNDYTVYFNSGSGKVHGDVVFAGFGICEPDRGRDDYRDLDVRGKVVLLYRAVPRDGQDWSKEDERDYKTRTALAKGASAVLMLETRDWPVRGGTLHEEGYAPGMPAVQISRKVARDIFHGTRRSLDDVLRDLPQKPQSFITGKRFYMDVQMENTAQGKGENVVGIVRGMHTGYEEEIIVIGAHMDHLGKSPEGHLYQGADDNASGTAVIMELARVFATRSRELRRTLVFVAFGGEEQGFRGSRYFAEHPTVPADRICAMLNFDMEGTGDGGCGCGGSNYFPRIVESLRLFMPDSLSGKLRVSRGWGMGGSDHAHFIEQGIPALGFFSTGGHPFYHRVEDDPGTLHVPSLQFVGDRACGLIRALGSAEESLLFQGLRQGRCFTLHGDQMIMDMHTRESMEKDIRHFVDVRREMGIRAVVVPLIEENSFEGDPVILYEALESWKQWIEENGKHLTDFNGAAALNDAAGSGRVAVAVGVEGAGLFKERILHFKNLAKLGLDVVSLGDPSGPLFVEGKWSAFGRTFFDVCRKENVLIDWTITDTACIRTMKEYQGRILFRFPPGVLPGVEEAVSGLKGRWNIVVECTDGTDPAAISGILDSWGTEKLHLSCGMKSLAEYSNPASGEKGDGFRLIQGLYEERIKGRDRNTVYKEMVRLLGGNLKEFMN